MTLDQLKEDRAFNDGWPKVWPALQEYLTARCLKSAISNVEPAATRELALLIQELGKVALPTPAPVTAPKMPALNSMRGDKEP